MTRFVRSAGAAAPFVALALAGNPPSALTEQSGAVPFAPELFDGTTHASPGPLEDGGRTFYFTLSAPDFSAGRIGFATRESGGWNASRALFDAGRSDAGPSIAADGAKLYFHSNRPTGLDGISDEWNLFVAERDGDEWSAPHALPPPLNSSKSECCVASAPDGSLYFASDRDGSWDIWGARKTANGWQLQKLPEGVNSARMEWPSWVDLVGEGAGAVERLLFSSIRPGGAGGDDLYVAFRRDGTWSAPRSLGPLVNTAGYEDSARLAPGGLFLFATRAPDGLAAVRSIDASALPLAP